MKSEVEHYLNMGNHSGCDSVCPTDCSGGCKCKDLTFGGAHDRFKDYESHTIVYDEDTLVAYISKKCVHKGVEITNREYWLPMNVSGYVDDNIIILCDKDEAGKLIPYTLKKAVESVAEVSRKHGAILSFFNNDPYPHWEIWLYDNVNTYEWENLKYWRSVYYVWNKFVGWYNTIDELVELRIWPIDGKYAIVGEYLRTSTLYKGVENEWIDLHINPYQYIIDDILKHDAITLTESLRQKFRDLIDTISRKEFEDFKKETDTRFDKVNKQIISILESIDSILCNFPDLVIKALKKNKVKLVVLDLIKNGIESDRTGLVSRVEYNSGNLKFLDTSGKIVSTIPLNDYYYTEEEIDSLTGLKGGKYTANSNTNYIKKATSLNDADIKLDSAIKVVEDKVTNAAGHLTVKNDEVVTGTVLKDAKITQLDKRKLITTVLGGYSKTTNLGAITNSDPLMTALSKLENADTELSEKIGLTGNPGAKVYKTNYGGKTVVQDINTIDTTIKALDYTLNKANGKVLTSIKQEDGLISAGTTSLKDVLLTGYSKTANVVLPIVATDSVNNAFSKVENTIDALDVTGDTDANKVVYQVNQVDGLVSSKLKNVSEFKLSGYSVGNDAKVAATDTIGGAFGKLQGQINAMDKTDSAENGKVVTTVTETDGKVSETKANVKDLQLGGYSKGTATGAIGSTDTINTALSKVENNLVNTINSLDDTDSAVAGKFVTDVVQTDGKVTASNKDFIARTIAADSSVATPTSDTVNVVQNTAVNFTTDSSKSVVFDSVSVPTKKYVDDQIEAAKASVYRYKGSKTGYSNLPSTGNVTGDVWNVVNEATVGDVTYPAGTNFAWNGSGWDPLGGQVQVVNNAPTLNSNAASVIGSVNGHNLSAKLKSNQVSVKADAATTTVLSNNNSDSSTLTIVGGTKVDTAVSGNAGSPTITVTHESTTRTNETSTASPAGGGTFTAIDSITTDDTGHITKVNTKTVTLPNPTASSLGAVASVSASGTAPLTLSASKSGTAVTITGSISVATQNVAGSLSAADKKKLDEIASGAEVNQNAFSNIKIGSVTAAADSKTDTFEIAATSPITVTGDATNNKVTIAHANSGVTAGTYRSVTVNATGHVTGGSNPTTTGINIKAATQGNVLVGTAGNDLSTIALGDNASVATDGFYFTSDENLKHNIRPISEDQSDVIWKENLIHDFQWNADNSDSTGFIAQELLKIMPEAVIKTESGILQVNYNTALAKLVGILWNRVHELEEKLNGLI